jgi:hypothetical protein
MIAPILFLINVWAEFQIDVFDHMTLASCSQALKYRFLYKHMDMKKSYVTDDPSIPDFVLTSEWLKKKCDGYDKQDLKRKMNIDNNVKDYDFNAIAKKLAYQHHRCYICKRRFTAKDAPTFDRIENYKPHTLSNIKLACCACNVLRSRRDPDITKVKVQLRNFALKYNLPTSLTNEDTIKQLEGAKYGGLTNVMHRVNIAGETHISKFRYKERKVISELTEYVLTHILGIDFNSLYPSVMASIKSLLIRYTDGILYMPGRFKERILDPVRMKELVEGRSQLFFVSVKAHFPEELYDKLINFAPIIRPYFTVEHIDNPSTTKGERKLTQLLRSEEHTSELQSPS